MPSKTMRQAAAAKSVSSAPAETAPAPDGFSLISNQKLLQLYASMLKCRMLDGRIRTECVRILAGKTDPAITYHPNRGREASAVGVLIDLVAGDTVAAPHGSLIPKFLNGMPLDTLFEALTPTNGTATQLSPFLDQALAAAEVNKATKNHKIAVVFPGRDVAAHKSWQLAIEHAALHALPILFVSHARQPLKAQPAGCPAIPVDGHDAVAVYRVAFESISRARHGRGPTLIECRRWKASGAVPHRDNNPIQNMEKYLTRKGLFTPAFKAETLAAFRKEIEAALATTRK